MQKAFGVNGKGMRLLISCVNSAVSLVGYDLAEGQGFWYCPGNILRSCGICASHDALWVATDNTLTRIDAQGIHPRTLPGPQDNLAHSVKCLDSGMLAVADTGNSRVLLLSDCDAIVCSPLEGWIFPLPKDAIHLNDMIPWQDGILASAFAHQPFGHLKQACPEWNREGLGVLFYMRRRDKRTLTRVAASGLNCPHSLTAHEGCIYCCSSSTGDFYGFAPTAHGTLVLERSWKVTDTHFLRGCLRVDGGWILGGSTRRHVREGDAGGMLLFHLTDDGGIARHRVAGVGEIYDILPWDAPLMRAVAPHLLRLPDLPLEGEFPPRCHTPL